MVNDMRRFAICEGTRRESELGSCLCFRQPQTISKPCSEPLDHRGDVRRIVLAVAIERDHDRSPRVIEPGRQSRSLTEVSPKADHANPRIAAVKRAQNGETSIGAAVVDE